MKVSLLAMIAAASWSGIGLAQSTGSPAPAPAQKQKGMPFSLSDLTSKLDMVESVADLTSWVGTRPEPRPEFVYAEKRSFDMQLHQSLKAGLPTVNVQVGGAATRSDLPERLSQWLNAVQKSGGQLRHCAVKSDERLFGLLAVGLNLLKKADKWMMYRPTGGYDAMLVTEGSEGKVLNAVFTERGAAKSCPEGTTDVGSEAVSS